jgi:hypothetical protein
VIGVSMGDLWGVSWVFVEVSGGWNVG